MFKIKLKKILIILISFSFFLSCQGEFSRKKSPESIKGVLDLRNWNFEKDGIVDLNGDWEFYWNKLLKPDDFSYDLKIKNIKKSIFTKIPGKWHNIKIGDKYLGRNGYATYRLIIKLNKKDRIYALKMVTVFTAYKLWVNNKLLSSNGKVGKSKKDMTPQFLPKNVFFNTNTYTIEIVLQVSNYFYSKGGLWASPKLGTENQIRSNNQNKNASNLFLFGSILIMAFYHFSLFFFRRKDRFILHFGIICFLIAFRIMVSGEHYLSALFPDFNWFVYMKLQILSYYLIVPVGALFIYELYSSEFSKFVLRIVLFISGFFIIMVMVLPVNIYTKFIIHYHVLTLLFCSYVIYVLIKGIGNKREGAILILCSFFLFLIFWINDILYENSIIHTGIFVHFGLFIFIFFQSYIILKRYLNAFLTVKDITENLEKKVKERTQELFIQHDKITSSIKYALKIQQAILPLEKKMKNTLGEYYIIYKPMAIVSGDFYWLSRIEDRIYIVVVDCTGHGVPGGFISMIGNTLLNKIINENKIYRPDLILEHLNEGIRASLKQKYISTEEEGRSTDGMDVSLCVIDKKNEKLIYAGAKRPLYIIENKNEPVLIEIRGNRKSIGGRQKKEKTVFTNHEIHIKTGSMIYLTSDGYVDQNNSIGKKFGSPKLKKFLLNISDKNMSEQKQLLIDELKGFQQDEPQRDDITLLGIRL